MRNIFNKIYHKLVKLRWQPIRVFCVHHVSNVFDDCTMHRGDWLQIDTFKHAIIEQQQAGYTFISIQDAYYHLCTDKFRTRKYAVLTADDGWASLHCILPWLDEQKIPISLFINPSYLDGKHFRERETEQYLTKTEVEHMYRHYPLVTIGSHGWEHIDAMNQSESEFLDNVNRSIEFLEKIPNFVPFYAYAWGTHTRATDELLIKRHITPVLMDGMKNYCKSNYIHRELFVCQ